jgi:hypothetical protein
LLSSVNSTNFANFLSYFSSKFRYEKKWNKTQSESRIF